MWQNDSLELAMWSSSVKLELKGKGEDKVMKNEMLSLRTGLSNIVEEKENILLLLFNFSHRYIYARIMSNTILISKICSTAVIWHMPIPLKNHITLEEIKQL